jgi:hypothetical protein
MSILFFGHPPDGEVNSPGQAIIPIPIARDFLPLHLNTFVPLNLCAFMPLYHGMDT